MKVIVNQEDIQTLVKEFIFHGDAPFATSVQIAKQFGINHKDLLQKIRTFDTFDAMIGGGKLRHEIRLNRGKEYPYYEMDADAYAFICLSITGKKAEKFKWAFIEAFKISTRLAIEAKVTAKVNNQNLTWSDTRRLGKDVRKMLTDTIQLYCEWAVNQRGKPYNLTNKTKCPFYKHVTDAVYEYLGLEKPPPNVERREVFNAEDLIRLEMAELDTIKLLHRLIIENGSRKGIKDKIKAGLEL